MENVTSNLLKLEPFNSGKLTEGIFKYQMSLMQRYINAGMLPTLPLDLNTKEHQKFLRDTMAWVTEELVEASNEFDKMKELMQQENYTLDEHLAKIKAVMPKLTEEYMDATHFFIELLIYSNIEADDMLGYYKNRLQNEGLWEDFQAGDALIVAMRYARDRMITNDESRVAVYNAFHIINAEDDYAGKHLGPELFVFVERINWTITQLLFTAKNKLKLQKEWKTSVEETNIQVYQELLMDAWVMFTVLLDLMGLDEKAIYKHYEAKNLKNQQRLNEGY